jgi:hypothetical protein
MSALTNQRLESIMSKTLRNTGLLLLIGGASACGGSSQGEQVRDARMEQVDERADAQQNSVERDADARDQAIDQRADKREDAIDAADRPGEDAREDLVGVSKERADYKSSAQERLDKYGVRINAADQKIQIMGAHAPSTLKGELQTAAKQYEQIKGEVTNLDRTPADRWERTTKQLEERESGLDERLDKLEGKLEDSK